MARGDEQFDAHVSGEHAAEVLFDVSEGVTRLLERGTASWKVDLAERPTMPDARTTRAQRSPGHVHVILVPGFAGFDALGQVSYYFGVTELAKGWRARAVTSKLARARRERVVLHYFDNLPTAGVATRAERLLRFLRKRLDRNEFQDGDRVVLVGHSTGGLDIRCLLLQLARSEGTSKIGCAARSLKPLGDALSAEEARRLLAMIGGVVFLSVPNRGTNIAEWARAWNGLRIPGVSLLANVVDLSDVPPFEFVDLTASWLAQRLRAWLSLRPSRRHLLSAVLDVWAENGQRRSKDPVQAAGSREALADLTLFVRHTHGDFFAIDDLAVRDQPPGVRSSVARWIRRSVSHLQRSEEADVTALARACEQARHEERQMWLDHHLEVRSYATRGKPGLPKRQRVNTDRVRKWAAWFGLLPHRDVPNSDFTYRIAYAACAAGPFDRTIRALSTSREPDVTAVNSGAICVDNWENDGIVNTRSMLWPNGADTIVVDADHGDIVGHYRLANDPSYASRAKRGRRFLAYDFFASDSSFSTAIFDGIWSSVLDFSEALGVQASTSTAGPSSKQS